jgi:G3E family GTPase
MLIPCHLINGPLGVGKTTAIIDYLRRTADRQFVAVVVNDFGPVGLDGAIIEGDVEKPTVMTIPGGCLCCSAAGGFVAAFREIAKQPKVTRIIVEPSGMALVGETVDLLNSLAEEFGLELRPIITLLDPKSLERPGFTRAPYHVRMIEAADILVANRCDLATPEQVERFKQWASELYPPKLRVITTDHGKLPDEAFELTRPPELAPATSFGFTIVQEHQRASAMGKTLEPSLVKPAHIHHPRDAHTAGLTWPAERRFRAAALEELLRHWAREGFNQTPLARLKGIVHTDEGWKLVEIACGEYHDRPTDYRRDNRIDWITESGTTDDAAVQQELEKHLIA